MAEKGSRWNKDELIVVLDLYFKLPFGRLNKNTPEVRELAKIIGRTPSSVAYRLVNYAACDPYILATGRHGMAAGRNVCQPVWNEYVNDKERLFFEAQQIKANFLKIPIEKSIELNLSNYLGKEREVIIRQRVNQQAFRTMILSNYENKCAISGIDIPELLIASHIIPWSEDKNNRLNPENGICLSPLYDRLFDKGLITIREDYTVQLSKELKERSGKEYYVAHFLPIQDKTINLPLEHIPNTNFLNYHQQKIFAPHN